MNGFLLSTSMNKELKGLREFSDKMNSFETLERTEITNLSNFSQCLALELQNLRIRDSFTFIEKYKSLLIVKNYTLSLPSKLFIQLRANKCTFHAIKRIIPLDLITKYDEMVIAAYTFKIQFEGRLCPEDLKSNLFKLIIPLVDNKVDLNKPDYVIIIQAFKGLVGITVMENDLNNFNFSFYKEENEPEIESEENNTQ